MTELQLSASPSIQEKVLANSAQLYLSNTRGLYIGPAQEPVEIRQATPLILLGLQGPLSVNGQSGRSFLIKPGCNMEVRSAPGQLLAAYFPDRNSTEYLSVSHSMTKTGEALSIGYQRENELINMLLEIFHSAPPVIETFMRLIQLLSAPPSTEDEPVFIYPRSVKRLMTYIRFNPIHSIPLDSIAKMEKTDVTTLKKAFEQTLGISVQGYQTWRRLYEVAYKIFSGTTLDAAVPSCGFKSEADFNMCFRNFFGMEASRIFNPGTRIFMNRYGKTF